MEATGPGVAFRLVGLLDGLSPTGSSEVGLGIFTGPLPGPMGRC